MASKINEVVAAYRKLRDQHAKLKKEFELAAAEITSKMDTLEAYMLAQTAELGVDSFKTEYGTCYKYHATSATVANWDEAIRFIRDNELWNLLERRVSKKAVEEYKEEHDLYPPGVDVRTVAKMGFRAN